MWYKIQKQKGNHQWFSIFAEEKKELISLFFKRKKFSKAEVSEKHSLTSPASEKEEIRDYASYFAFRIGLFFFF